MFLLVEFPGPGLGDQRWSVTGTDPPITAGSGQVAQDVGYFTITATLAVEGADPDGSRRC